jgi:hypothetical protein
VTRGKSLELSRIILDGNYCLTNNSSHTSIPRNTHTYPPRLSEPYTMRSTFSVTALATALVLGASSAWAQATRDQSQRCAQTLRWPEYQSVFNYKYDDTSIFGGGITYDVKTCTDPAVITNLVVTLNDFVDGRVYRCAVGNQISANNGTSSFTCRQVVR